MLCPRPRDEPERWELAHRSELPARALVQGDDDRLGRLFLSLSVAFNDLRGLLMFERVLRLYPRPAEGQLSVYAGQFRGIHVQIHRWIASVLQETMNVIAQEGRGVTDRPEFEALPTAYYSAGANMEQTRFYYADAAVQHRLLASSDPGTLGRTDELIVETAKVMNDALGRLIAAFVRSRAPARA